MFINHKLKNILLFCSRPNDEHFLEKKRVIIITHNTFVFTFDKVKYICEFFLKFQAQILALGVS